MEEKQTPVTQTPVTQTANSAPVEGTSAQAVGGYNPIAQAAGGIDTTIPLLVPDQALELECIKSEIKPSKNDENRDVLTMVFKTTREARLVGGKKAHDGYKLYKRWSVSTSEPHDGKAGRTAEDIDRDLALVLKAFFGPKCAKSPADLYNNPALVEGYKVTATSNIEKGSGGYPDKNGFSFRIPSA